MADLYVDVLFFSHANWDFPGSSYVNKLCITFWYLNIVLWDFGSCSAFVKNVSVFLLSGNRYGEAQITTFEQLLLRDTISMTFFIFKAFATLFGSFLGMYHPMSHLGPRWRSIMGFSPQSLCYVVLEHYMHIWGSI